MSKRYTIYGLVGLMLGWFVHFWPDFQAANESIRIYFVQSVVDYNSVSIDPALQRYGVRNVDKAMFEGKAYLDKAPGLSMAVMPLYWTLTRLGMSVEPSRLPYLSYLLLLFGVLLPAVMAVHWAYEIVFEWTRDEAAAWTTALTLGLATPFAFYSTLFFGHAPAAVLGLGSFYYLQRERPGIAGLLAGAMVLVDTPTAILATVLGVYAGLKERRLDALLYFGMGGIPGVAIQLAYNTLLFGEPFTFAYSMKATGALAEIHGKGLYGFQLPSLEAVWGLSFGAKRGLFFHAPVLLLSCLALFRPRDRRWKALFIPSIVYFLWISAFVDWPAGDSYFARHLVPIVPFLSLGVGLAMADERLGRVIRWGVPGGVLASLLLTWAPLMTFPYAFQAFESPVFELAVPLLQQVHLSPSLGRWLGLSDVWCLIVPIALLSSLLIFLRLKLRVVGASLAGLLLLAAMNTSYDSTPRDKALSRIYAEGLLGYEETAQQLKDELRQRKKQSPTSP